MPIKQLKWWEKEFLEACGFACLYQCQLSLDQFLASRLVEPEERELISTFLHSRNICR